MDRELAQMIAMTAHRVRAELGHLMPLLREHGDGKADDDVRQAIATAVYEIGVVADKVFEQHPELGSQAETRRNKYGRPYY
jgi:hypothetical protein